MPTKTMKATISVLAFAVSSVQAQYYRLEAPGGKLQVESCRDIDEGTYGDPKGTCAEHGFKETCISCHGSMEFKVKDPNTCDQKHTKCYFRGLNEECVGIAQCPYTDNDVSVTSQATPVACTARDPRATTWWCNINCNHVGAKFCPPSYCACKAATKPPPPPPPADHNTNKSMCVTSTGTHYDRSGHKHTVTNLVCCAATCGNCGGPECGSRPGGKDNCCVNIITPKGNSCEDNEPPCIFPANQTTATVAQPADSLIV